MASAGGSAPAVGESVGVEGADAGGVEGRSFVRGDDAYAGGGRGNVLLRRRLSCAATLELCAVIFNPYDC